MIKELIKLANHLDSKGCRKEADYLDAVIRKYAVSGSTTVRDKLVSWREDEVNVKDKAGDPGANYKITVKKGFVNIPLTINDISYNVDEESGEESLMVDASAFGTDRKDKLPKIQIDEFISKYEAKASSFDLVGNNTVTFNSV
jgi:hypothetical protein